MTLASDYQFNPYQGHIKNSFSDPCTGLSRKKFKTPAYVCMKHVSVLLSSMNKCPDCEKNDIEYQTDHV